MGHTYNSPNPSDIKRGVNDVNRLNIYVDKTP